MRRSTWSGSPRNARRSPGLRSAAIALGLTVCVAIVATVLVPSLTAQAAVGNGTAWTQAFDTAVPLGAVTSGGAFPGYSDLYAYRDGTKSTNGGTYKPSTVSSVEGGNLTWHLQGDGQGSSVTIGKSAIGGELVGAHAHRFNLGI